MKYSREDNVITMFAKTDILIIHLNIVAHRIT